MLKLYVTTPISCFRTGIIWYCYKLFSFVCTTVWNISERPRTGLVGLSFCSWVDLWVSPDWDSVVCFFVVFTRELGCFKTFELSCVDHSLRHALPAETRRENTPECTTRSARIARTTRRLGKGERIYTAVQHTPLPFHEHCWVLGSRSMSLTATTATLGPADRIM